MGAAASQFNRKSDFCRDPCYQTRTEVLKAVAGPAVTESMTFHKTSVRIYANVALVKAGKELRNRVFCESLAT